MNTSNKSEILVRPAKPHDHPFIVDFQLRMARETENLQLDDERVNKGVRAVMDDPSKGQYYVAEHDGLIIGSLLITYEWSDWRNGQIWWIQSVFIIPEYRGKGVFRQMYRFLKQRVENDEQLVGLRLYVDFTNRTAQKVYEAMGMDGNHYRTYEWIK